ncbi:MAG: hydratase [Hyphomicrobiaceae bacterium]|nr:hydratase [Hyphomicrobiaceae bacterium]
MTMTSDAVRRAAAQLAAWRAESTVGSELPEELRPQDASDAYTIQDAFMKAWPDRRVGWKIGATAVPLQQKLGVTEPFAGPFYAADTVGTPARHPARLFPHLCIESEFAFRFSAALPPRPAPYARADILAAIGSVLPAIELVGPRFDTLLFGRAPTAIADCALNAGFVLGDDSSAWRQLDLVAQPVVLRVDGRIVAEGTGANVLGDPVVVLEWAVNHLSKRGHGIAAGEIISTGTTTGLVHIEPNQTAVADFGPLGEVSVLFEGEPHPAHVPPPR